jgi:predicted RND superfamily exporter protein
MEGGLGLNFKEKRCVVGLAIKEMDKEKKKGITKEKALVHGVYNRGVRVRITFFIISFLLAFSIALPTFWILPYLSQIRISGQFSQFQLKSDPDLKDLQEIYQQFGSRHLLICSYRNENLLTKEGLTQLEALSQEFHDSSLIRSILSITSLQLPKKGAVFQEALSTLKALHQQQKNQISPEDSLRFPSLGFSQVSFFLKLLKGIWFKLPETPEELKQYREDLRNPILLGRLINPAGNYGGILLELSEEALQLRSSILLKKLKASAEKHLPPRSCTFLGRQAVYAYLEESLYEDFIQCATLGLVLLALCFGLMFRSLRGILLPSLSVALACIWMGGFIYFFNYEANILMISAPVFILAIGSTISTHLLMRYQKELSDSYEPYQAILRVLWGIKGAVFGSILTSILGFYALAFANIGEVLRFAHLVTFGLISCTFLNFSLFFILNTIFPRFRKVQSLFFLSAFLEKRLLPFILNYSKSTFFLFLILCGISLYGVVHVKPSYDIRSYLHQDSEILKRMEEVQAHLAGANILYIHLKAKKGSFQNPEILATLRHLQEKLLKLSKINAVLSYDSLLEGMSWLCQEKRKPLEYTSEDRLLLQHLLRLLQEKNHKLREHCSRLVSSDYSETLLILQSSETSLSWLESIHEELRALCQKEFAGIKKVYDAQGYRFNITVTGDSFVVKKCGFSSFIEPNL